MLLLDVQKPKLQLSAIHSRFTLNRAASTSRRAVLICTTADLLPLGSAYISMVQGSQDDEPNARLSVSCWTIRPQCETKRALDSARSPLLYHGR